MLTYNYRIYDLSKKKDSILYSNNNKKASSYRGMKQAVTTKLGLYKIKDAPWQEASDNEYIRDNNRYYIYIHVTQDDTPPPILPRYCTGEYDVYQ